MLRHQAAERGLSEARSVSGRIVAAARRHFFAHGFRGVTMDDLAQELGMSKKTLYATFPSKVDLLKAVLLDKLGRVDEDLEGIVTESASDFPAALHHLLVCLQGHMSEIQPPFLRDMQREMPEMFSVVEDRRRDLIRRHFGKLLRAGQRAGMIRKDIEVNLLIEILLGSVQAIMNPPRIAELGLTPKSGFTAIIRVFLEGVLTKAGRVKS
jgi:AcrR family transcriptional regulator